ncbi:cytochrome C biogenesis protein CcdA [Sporomusaceae bacterium FL31]|nr:cytochrome C biogenesis protein CcdA [Sporomusaceae bacterium FL31]GCE35167.1 cytochrome C biogenesis protein CcdA [Sporomusaceae bacterium]
MAAFSDIGIWIGALTGGLLSFFSPCVFPLIPVYLGYLAGNDFAGAAGCDVGELKVHQRKLQINVVFFVAGISTVYVSLGFLSGSIGMLLAAYRSVILQVSGLLVIIFGLIQLRFLTLDCLQQEQRLQMRKMSSGILGAYLLGLLFSFGWTPCIGPILSSILLLSSSENAGYAGLLLLVYSMGFGLPFILISFFTSQFLQYYQRMYPYFEKIRIAGGILLILMGLLLFSDQLNLFQRLLD